MYHKLLYIGEKSYFISYINMITKIHLLDVFISEFIILQDITISLLHIS